MQPAHYASSPAATAWKKPLVAEFMSPKQVYTFKLCRNYRIPKSVKCTHSATDHLHALIAVPNLYEVYTHTHTHFGIPIPTHTFQKKRPCSRPKGYIWVTLHKTYMLDIAKRVWPRSPRQRSSQLLPPMAPSARASLLTAPARVRILGFRVWGRLGGACSVSLTSCPKIIKLGLVPDDLEWGLVTGDDEDSICI